MTERSSITGRARSHSGRLAGALLLASPSRPDLTQRRGLSFAALALRVVAAGLLGWIGYIHWHLWQQGYRYLPTNGPLFLVDAIAAVVVAVLLLVWARPLTGLLAAGFTASTIGALVISLWVGLFGFHESIHASYVVESLVLESVVVIIVAAWTVIAATAVARSR
jgi:hypothetical protein